MKNNKDHIENFEDLFKETLNKSQITPPPGVWEGLSAGLSSTSISTTAAAASKLGLLGKIVIGTTAAIGSYIGYQAINSNKVTMEQESIFSEDSNLSLDNSPSTKAHATNSDSSDIAFYEDQENGNFTDKTSNKNSLNNELDLSANDSRTKNLFNNELNNGEISEDANQSLNDILIDQNKVFVGKKMEINIIKNPKCVGDTLKVLSSEKKTSWLINGKMEGEGQELNHIFTTKGIFRIEAQLGSEKESMKIDIKDNPTLAINIQQIENKSHFIELLPKTYTEITWVINGEKYFSSEVLRDFNPNTTYNITAIGTHICGDFKIDKNYNWKQSKTYEDPNYEITIPNVFTPNNDGLNDIYKVEIPQVEFFVMKIFDKQGNNLLFETTNPRIGWNGIDENGKEYNEGEYIVQLKYKQKNNKMIYKNYKITLIRK